MRRQLVIAALLGFVAAGQNLVILGGREGIDLSVGALVGLGRLLAGNVMNGSDAAILSRPCSPRRPRPSASGILNGLGVTLVRIPPLVMTLGMPGVVQGVLVLTHQRTPSGNAAPALITFITQPLMLGLPGMSARLDRRSAARSHFCSRTRFGRSSMRSARTKKRRASPACRAVHAGACCSG